MFSNTLIVAIGTIVLSGSLPDGRLASSVGQWRNDAPMPVLDAGRERSDAKGTAAQRTARSYVRAAVVNEGSPRFPCQNWYLFNTSSDRLVVVTVELVTGGSYPNRTTMTISLEPGTRKFVTSRQLDRIRTDLFIRGARFG